MPSLDDLHSAEEFEQLAQQHKAEAARLRAKSRILALDADSYDLLSSCNAGLAKIQRVIDQ